MRKKVPIAAYLFFLIFNKDKNSAKRILSLLDHKELRILSASLKILDPNDRDLKEKFQKEYSNFSGQDKGILPDTTGKTSLTGKGPKSVISQNNDFINIYIWILIVGGLIGIITLFMYINKADIASELKDKTKTLWLSYLAYLILFPFFLSYAVKYRYFSKIGNFFQTMNLLIPGSLFLIGLLAILNYITGNMAYGKVSLDKSLIGLILFGIILGPWIEEVLFRGFILDLFIMIFSKNGEMILKGNKELLDGSIPLVSLFLAISASSFCFAFIHQWVNLAGLFIYFICGMILGYLRIKSGNLWISFFSHSIANGTLLLFG